MGKRRIIAETGAGQHGVATATVCARFGLDCVVYMGEEDMRRQRLNVYRMELMGAKVVPVTSGTKTLKRSEEHTSELQSRLHLVCRLLLEKKKTAPRTAGSRAS